MNNKKIYKDKKSQNNMIFPGDPKGLPDDFSNAIIFVDNDSNGIYNIVLTNVNLNFFTQYYLGVAVGNDSEMTPRINLTSSPYAFEAKNVRRELK